jgi:hypothetical protein
MSPDIQAFLHRPNSLYSTEWQKDVSDLWLEENIAYKLLISLSCGENSFLYASFCNDNKPSDSHSYFNFIHAVVTINNTE